MMAGTEDDRKRLDDLIRENTELLDAVFVNFLRQPGQEQDKIACIEKTLREKQENQRLIEKDKRSEQENQRNSLSGAYGSTKDNFKQPPLKLNSLVVPSCEDRIVKTKDVDGNDLEPEPLRIPSAEIEDSNEAMWATVEDVTIPTRSADGSYIPSSLAGPMHQTGKLKKLEYANETEIQNLCRSMITDALSALGLTAELVRSHLEISIYTMRPDILLVLRRQGRIFFVVEVKSPEVRNIDNVFRSPNVAGQIWSYMSAMKAMGDKQPMGAVMTYNKISLVTLDDLSNDEAHKTAVQKAKDQLRSDFCPNIITTKEAEPDCQNRTSTPDRKSHYKTAGKREQDDEACGTTGDEQEEIVPAVVYSTKPYEGKLVFPCLLQALHIAYQKTTDGNCEIVPRISHNDALGRRLVFKVSRCGFNWVMTPRTIKTKEFKAIHASVLPRATSEYYYVLGKLGEGNTAAAYLICNSTGRLATMKDYFMKSPPMGDEDEGRDDSLFKLVTKEKGMWDALYFGRLTSRVEYLGGYPCLLMPYGHEIDGSERIDCVPAIKAELEHFANKEYRYEFSDLRWRHVLLDAGRKVFLCDLASLEKFDASKSSDVVFDQLEVLLKVLVTDAKIAAALKLLAGSSTERNNILGNPSIYGVFEKEVPEISSTAAWSPETFEDESAKNKVLVYMICCVTDKETGQGSSPEISVPSLAGDQDGCQEEGSSLPAAKRKKTGP